jgi:23S rRNA (uracil1939-C5)-methyltransferase
MLYGGDGATAAGERSPFVLPGELVSRDGGGELTILESSADRIAPACAHFGACGGCHYQHAEYPAQLRIKEAILRDIVGSHGLTETPKIEVHSGPEWRYRNRIRLRVGEVDGELRAGYNRHGATGGEAMLPVAMCPVAAPLLWQAATAVIELAKSEPAVRGWLASAVELEFFTNADETALHLTLFTRGTASGGFAELCAALQRRVPQLTGAGVAMLPKRPSPQGRRFEPVKAGAQWGAAGLLYQVDGYGYWVGRGGFFQINRYLLPTLAGLAAAGRTGEIAWDLYAGAGLFSRALTKSFGRVTGVEAAEPAAGGLAAALKPPHRALAMTTLDFLQAAVVQRERPELIVMDPPRAGLGAEVCGLLGRIRAPEMVYVSCDPVTLARDLKLLVGSGYRIAALHLVDMFPQTFHMETVAVLVR